MKFCILDPILLPGIYLPTRRHVRANWALWLLSQQPVGSCKRTGFTFNAYCYILLSSVTFVLKCTWIFHIPIRSFIVLINNICSNNTILSLAPTKHPFHQMFFTRAVIFGQSKVTMSGVAMSCKGNQVSITVAMFQTGGIFLSHFSLLHQIPAFSMTFVSYFLKKSNK